MARLTAAERNALPSSDFADPVHRAYPINDASHAAAAKSMAHYHPSLKKKIYGLAKRKGYGGKPVDSQ